MRFMQKEKKKKQANQEMANQAEAACWEMDSDYTKPR